MCYIFDSLGGFVARIKNFLEYRNTIFGDELAFPTGVRVVARRVPGAIHVKIKARRREHDDGYKRVRYKDISFYSSRGGRQKRISCPVDFY